MIKQDVHFENYSAKASRSCLFVRRALDVESGGWKRTFSHCGLGI